jgi:hypothetical protein
MAREFREFGNNLTKIYVDVDFKWDNFLHFSSEVYSIIVPNSRSCPLWFQVRRPFPEVEVFNQSNIIFVSLIFQSNPFGKYS